MKYKNIDQQRAMWTREAILEDRLLCIVFTRYARASERMDLGSDLTDLDLGFDGIKEHRFSSFSIDPMRP